MRPTRPVVVLTFADAIKDAHLELLKKEQTDVENALWKIKDETSLEIYKEASLTSDELKDIFIDKDFQDRIIIFHYAGHAQPEGLETEGGKTNAKGLAGLLGQEDNLKLVVLNGCSTEEMVKLMKENNVPAVIATSTEIGDDPATKFSTDFYTALSNGEGLQTAFEYAISAFELNNDEKPSQIVQMRSIKIEDASTPTEEIPWSLYHSGDNDILDWTLFDKADKLRKSDQEISFLNAKGKKDYLLSLIQNQIDAFADILKLISKKAKGYQEILLLQKQSEDNKKNNKNKENTIKEFIDEKLRIARDLMVLVGGLLDADFLGEDAPEEAEAPEAYGAELPPAKKGGIWVSIPKKIHKNELGEISVRVALDEQKFDWKIEEADDNLREESIRVSDKVSVEPPGSSSRVEIIPADDNIELEIDEDSYTEWIFDFTPKVEGKMKLRLKVKIIPKGSDPDDAKPIYIKEVIEVLPALDEFEEEEYDKAVDLVEEEKKHRKLAALAIFPIVKGVGGGNTEGETEPNKGNKGQGKPAPKPATAGLSGGAIAGIIAAVAAVVVAGLTFFGGNTQKSKDIPLPFNPLQETHFYNATVGEILPIPVKDFFEGSVQTEVASLSIVEAPKSGEAVLGANALTYTPNAAGEDVIKVQACNEANECDELTITIQVVEKDVPVFDIVKDHYKTDGKVGVPINIPFSAILKENESLQQSDILKLVDGSHSKEAAIDLANQQIVYTGIQKGPQSFQVDVCRGEQCDHATIDMVLAASQVPEPETPAPAPVDPDPVPESPAPAPPPAATMETATVTGISGKVYKIGKIGDKWWMLENVNENYDNIGSCYDSNSSNCNSNGRLYNYYQADSSCYMINPPEFGGYWRVPTREELKSVAFESGMNFKKAGFRTSDGTYRSLGSVGAYWSSSNKGDGTHYYLKVSGSNSIGTSQISFERSCRCVLSQ